MNEKMKSRKFWLSVASFLAAFGSAIVGMATDNNKLATVGLICSAVSSAIYTFVNGMVKVNDCSNDKSGDTK